MWGDVGSSPTSFLGEAPPLPESEDAAAWSKSRCVSAFTRHLLLCPFSWAGGGGPQGGLLGNDEVTLPCLSGTCCMRKPSILSCTAWVSQSPTM